MWGTLAVFVVIGLLAGAAGRLFYRGREPGKVLGSMLLGAVGSLLGGLVSLSVWPAVDGQLYSGALLTSLCGAVLLLVAWAAVAYARSVSVAGDRVG
jgi:uncharacterized membrane protein YeaQ/YmgE (transglycosylase-associated protein family)